MKATTRTSLLTALGSMAILIILVENRYPPRPLALTQIQLDGVLARREAKGREGGQGARASGEKERETVRPAPKPDGKVTEQAKPAETAGGVDEGGCTLSDYATRLSVYLIAVCLISLSVLFEHAKEKIEELASGSLRAVVDSLWGELTVLGFIALVTFMIGKTAILQQISFHVFTNIEDVQERTTRLTELVEACHFLLFAMMLGYISLVFLLILAARQIEKNYGVMEEECAIPKQVIERYYQGLHSPDRSLRKRVSSTMHYFIIRQQFISPEGHPTPQKRLRQNFDFASYLGKTLGIFLTHLVDLNNYTWMAMLILMTTFWAVSFLGEKEQVIAFVLFGWLLVSLALLVWVKLRMAAHRVLPHPPRVESKEEADDKAKETTHLLKGADPESHDDVDVQDTLKTLGVKDPKYLSQRHFKQRGWVMHRLLGPPPNLHEEQFWFDRAGPFIHFQITQLVLIGLALYLAAFLTAIIPSTWSCFSAATVPFVWALCIAPVLVVFVLTPEVVRLHGLLTNIEMMKNQQTVVEVQREMKTRASLTAIKLLQNIVVRTRKNDGTSKHSGEKISLSQKQVSYLRDVFCLFDKDRSGTISVDELSGLFSALGIASTPEELDMAVRELDGDNSGDVTFDEFVEYMATRMNEPLDEEESLEAMFKFFDHDGDGKVTAQEFWETVQALGVDFTIDEIRALIGEVDESGDGEIDLEEFSRMMKRHLEHSKT